MTWGMLKTQASGAFHSVGLGRGEGICVFHMSLPSPGTRLTFVWEA